MSNGPESWDDYFGALVAEWARRQRSADWPIVQRVKVERFMEGQCHPNAEAYAKEHGGEVVHGYVFMRLWGTDVVQVIAHSIVRMEGNHLEDPTPNEVPPESLPFLEHRRHDVPFDAVVNAFPMYCAKVPS